MKIIILNEISGRKEAVEFSGNFSYKKIESLTTITIPAGQQMIVKGRINIKGKLIIKGQLALVR